MRGPAGAARARTGTLTTEETSRRPPPRRMITIGLAIAAMVVLTLVLGSVIGDRGDRGVRLPNTRGDFPEEPIPSEAGSFRLHPADLAAAPDEESRPTAHPRTLSMYRTLRAFPGAPPRVPHGLTKDEFRETRCNTCHRRGGYVQRFGAYAPVNPHPEYGDCLQCHVADDARVGIEFPAPAGSESCAQCHGDPDAEQPAYVPLDWRSPSWPELGQQALPEAPGPIPHDLHLRGNCLACHAGPAAVEEIRTDHAERRMCRGCHVVHTPTGYDPTDDVSARPVGGTGGGP